MIESRRRVLTPSQAPQTLLQKCAPSLLPPNRKHIVFIYVTEDSVFADHRLPVSESFIPDYVEESSGK